MFDVLCKDTRYTASTWEVQVNGLTSHLTHRITAEMWILNLVLWPEKLRVCVCASELQQITGQILDFQTSVDQGQLIHLVSPILFHCNFIKHKSVGFCLC